MKSEDVRRLRLALRDRLSFLPGYPLGQEHGAVLWMPAPSTDRPPAKEPVRISRDQIRRATKAWKLAIDPQMQDALPHVVNDVNAWGTGMPVLLELMKQSVHHDEDFPPSPLSCGFTFRRRAVSKAENLIHSHPVLQPLVNALAWQYCLDPTEADRVFEWTAEEARWLSGIFSSGQSFDGISLSMFLYSLETHHPHRHQTRPILRVLSNPVASNTPTSFGDRYVERWLKFLNKAANRNFASEMTFPEKPSSFGSELSELLDWLRKQSDPKLSQRTLRLFGLVFPDGIVSDWARWWSAADAWTKEVCSLLEDLSKYSDYHKSRSNSGKKKRWQRLLSELVFRDGQNAKQTIDVLRAQGKNLLNENLRATANDRNSTFEAMRNLVSLKMTNQYEERMPETVKEPECVSCFDALCSMLEAIDNSTLGMLPRAKAVCACVRLFCSFRPRDVERVVSLLMHSRVNSRHWPNVLEDDLVIEELQNSLRDDSRLTQAFENLAVWTEDFHAHLGLALSRRSSWCLGPGCRRHILPKEKAVGSTLSRPLITHSDCDMTSLLDDWLEVGQDAIQPERTGKNESFQYPRFRCVVDHFIGSWVA